MADIVRIHASSGTTGKPTVVGYTKGDIDTWSQLMARSIRAAGGRSDRQDPRRLWLRPVHRRPRRPLRRRVSGRRRHSGRRRLHRAAGAAHPRFQARHHHGDAVLYAGDRRRVRAAGTRARATAACGIGIFGAEPWTESMRAEIERRMGMQALDIYGLSEVMGPGVAQECAETQGRPDGLGGSFLSRDHRSRHRPCRCPTASPANSSSPR